MIPKPLALLFLVTGLAAALFLRQKSAKGSTDEEEPEDAPEGIHWPEERVLLIGDSLSVGLDPHLRRALDERGVGAYSFIGEGGTNILQWSDSDRSQGARLVEALRSFQPTLVLISLGTNDEAARKPSLPLPYGPTFDVAKQRAPKISALQVRLGAVRSVWLGPPKAEKWGADRGFRNLLASIWGDDYFDTEAVAPEKGRDRVHFTTAGTKVWLAAILEHFE